MKRHGLSMRTKTNISLDGSEDHLIYEEDNDDDEEEEEEEEESSDNDFQGF
jgi:hypothetical protein